MPNSGKENSMNTEELQIIVDLITGMSGDAKFAFIAYLLCAKIVPIVFGCATGAFGIVCVYRFFTGWIKKDYEVKLNSKENIQLLKEISSRFGCHCFSDGTMFSYDREKLWEKIEELKKP